jgi:hypothetical protein
VAARTELVHDALRTPQLGQTPQLAAAYSSVTRSRIALLGATNAEIALVQSQMTPVSSTGTRPPSSSAAGPGSPPCSAHELAEFGDDPTRFIDAKARKNYAGTGPIARQSGKKSTVRARFVHNDRLVDAPSRQA